MRDARYEIRALNLGSRIPERVAGERALPALAWAREEHGLKRPEEEPIIAPEHEYTGRNHRWNKSAGCHL